MYSELLASKAYTQVNSKVGIMTRRRPEFEPGEADAEAAKLKKFSDAPGSPKTPRLWGGGGSRIQWLPDAVRNQFLNSLGYISSPYNSL